MTTDDPSEALQVLDDLSRPSSVAPGVEMRPLREVGIFFSPDDLARDRHLRAMRWPRFKDGNRDAVEEWQRHALQVAEYQKALKGEESTPDTAAPISSTRLTR